MVRPFAESAPPNLPQLSPELAVRDPEAFKIGTLQHLAHASTFGAQIWNKTLEHGAVSYDDIALDASTWASFSTASGFMRIGVAPIPDETKEAILFHGERLSYADEVAYRFLHEATHSYT